MAKRSRERRAMSAEEVAAYLDARSEWAVLTTLQADGYPHSVTLGYFRLGEDVYLGMKEGTQKVRNVEREARASVLVTSAKAGVRSRGCCCRGRRRSCAIGGSGCGWRARRRGRGGMRRRRCRSACRRMACICGWRRDERCPGPTTEGGAGLTLRRRRRGGAGPRRGASAPAGGRGAGRAADRVLRRRGHRSRHAVRRGLGRGGDRRGNVPAGASLRPRCRGPRLRRRPPGRERCRRRRPKS